MRFNSIKLSDLSGVFLIGFCAAVFVAAGLSLGGAARSLEKAGARDFFNGTWAATYERALDKTLPHFGASTKFWGALGYHLFKEGKPGVLVGRDGWLFSSEEFDYPNGFEQTLLDRVGYISNVQKTLAEKNIKLFVVPIPAKARVYPDKLGRYKFPDYWEGRYDAFLLLLKGQKVETIDLYRVFSKSNAQLYLRTDTHWTPEAARITAQAVAERATLIWPYAIVDHKAFIVRADGAENHIGDLMRYLTAGDNPRVKPEKISRVKIETIAEDGELFGNVTLPIALVGTSYSAGALWNFEGFLKEAFQADVLNAADEGLGPFEVMERYLKDESLEKTPPHLVIWEIPERYLAIPDGVIAR